LARLGLCLVGPGGIAGLHMRAIQELGLCTNLWVVGETAGSAKAFRDEWGFKRSTTDGRAALEDDDVQVVLVTSPNTLHSTQTLEALEAGKDVVCEIPLAVSAEAADQVVRRADELGRRVCVCHTMRSYPATRLLRARVRAGQLDIRQIQVFSATARRDNEHWAGGKRTWVDSLLWHHGGHVVDATMWMLGIEAIADLSVMIGAQNPAYGMTMDVVADYVSDDRRLVSHVLTYNATYDLTEFRIVAGDEGFVLRAGGLSDVEGHELSPAVDWADLRTQDREVFEALLTGEPCEFDAATVLPAMRVLGMYQERAGDLLR
jgi:2-hydroxy-4-carboxymuconate semialdehyde hemiacetal dehydrogenase